MKILHICKKYDGALGGDAVVVTNLQKQQRAAGHEVRIVTSNCDEILNGTHIYKFGFKDTPAGLDDTTLKRLASLAALFFRMFAILRKERPDVIHTHSIDMAFFASFAARFYRVPIVHTFHILTFYDSSQSAIRRKSEVWLAKKAHLHAVTAPNGYDVKKLQTANILPAVELPNGVDASFWGADTITESSKAFVFVAVGRLERQKGYEYLVKAAALLARTSSDDFQVVIVGEGSQKKALHELIKRLHLEGTVTLAGSKKPEEVRTLLAQADAAVFSSLYETTPITLLEAWAAGVPAIATSVGILRDVGADFGAAYIVPSKDEQALMVAMKRCMSDEQSRETVAVKGHEEARKYTWPAIAQTAEAIYRGVL